MFLSTTCKAGALTGKVFEAIVGSFFLLVASLCWPARLLSQTQVRVSEHFVLSRSVDLQSFLCERGLITGALACAGLQDF